MELMSNKLLIYNQYRHTSMHVDKVNFSLSVPDFTKIVSQNCFYCGAPPENYMSDDPSTPTFFFNHIEMIDTPKGYKSDNCRSLCNRCRNAKMHYTDKEFFEWVSTIHKNCRIPFTVESGPVIMFDTDDTLVAWDNEKYPKEDLIEINCGGIISHRMPNKHNIELLKKMYKSGHIVVVWSGSGVRWCTAVIEALGLTRFVHGYLSKPKYYVDDVKDANEWIGKYGYFDFNGKRVK